VAAYPVSGCGASSRRQGKKKESGVDHGVLIFRLSLFISRAAVGRTGLRHLIIRSRVATIVITRRRIP
jgi:hypothetical protein